MTALDWTLFELTDAPFKDILPTTWEEVEEAGYVERVQWDYRLTAYGWLKALEAAGRLGGMEMKGKLGKLCAAMKSRCEEGGRSQGRHDRPGVGAGDGLLRGLDLQRR